MVGSLDVAVMLRMFCPDSFAGPVVMPAKFTVCNPAVFATLRLAMAASVGASFTAVTLIVKVCGALVSTPPKAVPPLSCATTVTVAEPFAFVAGVKVSVPLDAMAGCVRNSALLSFVTAKVTTWPDSFAGPGEMPVRKLAVVLAPESSSTVTLLALSVKLGAWFTGTMVMVKVFVLLSTPPLRMPPSSCTMTVTVAVPIIPAAGVKVSVPKLSIAGCALKSALLLLESV